MYLIRGVAVSIALGTFLACSSQAFAQESHQLPDPGKTPGHATYHTAAKVCGIKSTKDERNVPDSAKNEVYSDYGVSRCVGYCSGRQGCEIDHLISLVCIPTEGDRGFRRMMTAGSDDVDR
jgi:hypothetical protein